MAQPLNETAAREVLLAALYEVAPEAADEQLDVDEPLTEQLDIDSMDLLNVMIGLHRRTGVEIPERDYPQLATLSGAVRYLVAATISASV